MFACMGVLGVERRRREGGGFLASVLVWPCVLVLGCVWASARVRAGHVPVSRLYPIVLLLRARALSLDLDL